jgi:hypothetical protein
MRSTFLLALALLTVVCASTQVNAQSGRTKYLVSESYDYDSVSTVRPNAVSFELAGRGIGYGVNYDRSINDAVALGVGFATYSLGVPSTIRNVSYDLTVTYIPLYANFYFQPNRHRGFLSAGATLTHVKGKVNSNYTEINGINAARSGFLGTLGGGYEFRASSGFLFRASLYKFLGPSLPLWPGITLGGTF